MTTEERATRRAERQRHKAERAEREKQDKALMLAAVREILADDTAKASERLIALSILDSLEMYHVISHALHDSGRELAAFSEILKAATAEESTTT